MRCNHETKGVMEVERFTTFKKKYIPFIKKIYIPLKRSVINNWPHTPLE